MTTRSPDRMVARRHEGMTNDPRCGAEGPRALRSMPWHLTRLNAHVNSARYGKPAKGYRKYAKEKGFSSRAVEIRDP